MKGLLGSVAISAARFDAWADEKPWRNRLPGLLYMPLAAVPLLVSGSRRGTGLGISLGVGLMLSIGALFGLPWYGNRLLGTPSRAATLAGKTRACRRLLDAVGDQLDPQRIADANLILNSDLPAEALKLILMDLGTGTSKPNATVRDLAMSAARSVGIDKETRSLLAAVGCVA